MPAILAAMSALRGRPRRKHQIAAWHQAHLTNAPTEAANNLIKRVAFDLTREDGRRIKRTPAMAAIA